MSTAVGIMDRDDWHARTDNLAVVDPSARLVLSIPRDLWSDTLRDRINGAFARGGHEGLKAALSGLGRPVDYTVCIRRAAIERVLSGVEVTVPVQRRLEFRYPMQPTARIEDGEKRISFEPPAEILSGERIHQWIGARFDPWGGGWDLFRIKRQHVLVRRLLEMGFPFERVLEEPDLVSVSDPRALDELALVRPTWRFAIIEDVRAAWIDGQEILLRGRPNLLERARLWIRWRTRRLRNRH